MRLKWMACGVAVVAHVAVLLVAVLWAPPQPGGGDGIRPALSVRLLAAQAEDVVPTTPSAQAAALPADSLPARKLLAGSISDSAGAQGASGDRFYAPDEVDRQALPASALDLLDTADLVTEPSPFTLRIYVDSEGHVIRAEIVEASAGNRAAAARVALILEQTRFIPARRAGGDVAAVRELEFGVDLSEEGGLAGAGSMSASSQAAGSALP